MIESTQNERVKTYAKLKEKKERNLQGLFIVEGEHLVEEALKKRIVKEVFLLKDEENKYGNVTYASQEVMGKISDLKNAPKVLAICHKIPNTEIKGNVIILDNIKDPGNLGTIIRSAVAFNYETIILGPTCVDIYNSKVIRATEGMLFNVNILIDNLSKVVSNLKENGYKIYGTDVSGGTHASADKNKHALIIGSEAKGISPELLCLTDQNLYINMNPLCESLNAGVSASILMYELNK